MVKVKGLVNLDKVGTRSQSLEMLGRLKMGDCPKVNDSLKSEEGEVKRELEGPEPGKTLT